MNNLVAINNYNLKDKITEKQTSAVTSFLNWDNKRYSLDKLDNYYNDFISALNKSCFSLRDLHQLYFILLKDGFKPGWYRSLKDIAETYQEKLPNNTFIKWILEYKYHME